MAADLALAGTVVSFSIILSGILIGLGKTLNSKRLEHFGTEELIQSVINAALVGAYTAILAAATEISKSIVTGSVCNTGDAIENLQCIYSNLSVDIFALLTKVISLNQIVSYYQTLTLEFATFSIQPMSGLSSITSILTGQILTLQALLTFAQLQVQLLGFFAPQLLTFFLPVGLIFRSFFSTRKLGGFLIAISIGAYLFYPAFILIFPVPVLNDTVTNLTNLTNKSLYTTMPILDMNDNYAIAGKLDNMTAGDFTGDLTLATQQISKSISALSMFVLIAPLFSLIITIIFIKEVTDIFGGEFFFAVSSI
ncbi:hypothetical protein H0O01_01250 [Candidatus Micrarchaeota archaeon]|nr:hypothetical protein [Candidatus Micrarchaeota archaeon]